MLKPRRNGNIYGWDKKKLKKSEIGTQIDRGKETIV
jgi:hypothetical protein